MKDGCVFHSSGYCTILSETECTGTRSKLLCSFRKTYQEFEADRNAAISLNRLKGNCNKCKYKKQGDKCEYRGVQCDG